MDLQSLPALTVLSDYVTIVEYKGLKVVRVIHDKAFAAISLFGAHVLSFKPTGQEDLLFMSTEAALDNKTAIRGGIPVCWPWFGPAGQPSHGFARIREWSLIEHRETEDGVIISLGLTSYADTLAYWPNQFEARLNIEISEKIKITLDVQNTDDKTWTFTGALHSYLNIGDIRQVKTTGMGHEFIDKLQDNKVCQGGDELILTDTIDRIYTKADSTLTVHDPVLNRSLIIENEGQNAAVIWNPWENGAKSMADMDDEGFTNMICVEPAVFAPTLAEGQAVQPGEHYCLATTLSTR